MPFAGHARPLRGAQRRVALHSRNVGYWGSHADEMTPLTVPQYEIQIVRHSGLINAVVERLNRPPEQESPRWPTQWFLEAGAGRGGLSTAIARLGFKGHAVDYNTSAVDLLYDTRLRFDVPGMTPVHQDMSKWPRLSPLMYGCVFSEGVLDHLSDLDGRHYSRIVDFMTACFFNSPENIHSVRMDGWNKRRCCRHWKPRYEAEWIDFFARLGMPVTATFVDGANLCLEWSM